MSKKDFSGMDRRRYYRLEEEDVVVCETLTGAIFGKSAGKHVFTKTLSEGGLLFETDEVYPMGELLKLEVDIPGWEKFKTEFYKGDKVSGRQPLVVIGKVVRVEDVGRGLYDIGVAFTAIDKGHLMALKKYIEQSEKIKK